MKKIILITFLIFSFAESFSQQVSKAYEEYVQKADLLFNEKEYSKAAQLYSLAFDANGGLGKVRHRYKAAACWTQLSKPDSAFVQLNKIAGRGNFTDYELLSMDVDFMPLHNDPRWPVLIEKVRQNQVKTDNKQKN
jgi:hypothetical protein